MCYPIVRPAEDWSDSPRLILRNGPRLIARSSTLQHAATRCNALQRTATHCNTLQTTTPSLVAALIPRHGNTLQHTVCSVCVLEVDEQVTILKSLHTLQHSATLCNTLQHTATHCNTLQHTAAHCSTLQHTVQSACGLGGACRLFIYVYIYTYLFIYKYI